MAFSTHDQVPDSPTNVFATWNSLAPISTPLYDGALQSYGSTSGARSAFSTIQIPTTGKWYIEILLTNAQYPQCAIAKLTATGSGANTGAYGYYHNQTSGAPYVMYDGAAQSAASSPGSTTISSGFNATSGNITRIYIDADNNQIWFANNTTWATSDNSLGSTPTFGTSGVFNNSLDLSDGYFVFVSNGNGTDRWFLNAGQDSSFGGNKTSGSADAPDAKGYGSFYYQPPTGALALCTANLPDPDIDPNVDDLPEDYFKAVKYTGQTTVDAGTWDNVNSTLTVAVGFQPDLVWTKARNYNGAAHFLSDSIRGGTQALYSNSTTNEVYRANHIQSFDSNGFTLGADGTSNISGYTHVAWCFRAGGAPSGSTSTTGSAKRINTSGTQDDTSCSALASAASATITPTLMSINQKAGFSIIKYTGTGSAATVPHGLSATPEFVIIKNLDVNSTYWIVYHREYWEGSGANNVLLLPLTTVPSPNSTIFNSTQPSSSVVTLGTNGGVNTTNINYIMYCWHSVAGFSAFGSYEGNGSADGPFVYTGFKPAWVMVKATNLNGSSWFVWDNQRSPYNEMVNALLPNDSMQELTDREMDFLSNGFKPRANDGNYNQNYTYIYAAFAEMPFKYATAR